MIEVVEMVGLFTSGIAVVISALLLLVNKAYVGLIKEITKSMLDGKITAEEKEKIDKRINDIYKEIKE